MLGRIRPGLIGDAGRVLESVTPAQRVAVILHDVFGYSFAEVARITGRTPAACRELASAARRRIRAAQPPAAPAPRRAALISEFRKAWQASDISALIGLLDPAATMTADGGGLVPAALHPIEGSQQIARYLADLAGRAPGNLTILERTVNGQPGLVAQQDHVTVTVFAFQTTGHQITRIWAVRNPRKLRPWATRLRRCHYISMASKTSTDPPLASTGQPVAFAVASLSEPADTIE